MLKRRSFRSRSGTARKSVPTSGNSASGSEVKRCGGCSIADRRTKETIRNGMLLIRVSYGLPYSELPDLQPCDLDKYLLFLLQQGLPRVSVPFPRRQVGGSGLCGLQRLRRHERWGLAHSLASIKRNLPSGCHSHVESKLESWGAQAFSQPPPPSDDYVSFAYAESSRIFSSCWDKNYDSFVWNHLPNASARFSGVRADLVWQGRREEFIRRCLSETEESPSWKARYKEVPSAGKTRALVIFDDEIDLLAPLHKCMYSHLRKQDWLLCGPPTDKRMESVLVNAHQTSVDLVNATDGLSLRVTDAILDAAFFSSVKVPRSLRALAKASFHPDVYLGSPLRGVDSYRRIGTVQHGQMMGAYLSFPLLCLHSYIAARWAARFDEGARFLVNGDDTVISASRSVTERDYPSGYRLNVRKTIRASAVAELNSTVFLRRSGRWREVRHLRRGGAVSDVEGMIHMASAVRGQARWTDAFVRSRIGKSWGFLPSQLGLCSRSYPAFCRQREMTATRYHTSLPWDGPCPPSSLLVPLGREAYPCEAEAARALLWREGREGGSKRDVLSLSRGAVRRSYGYVRRNRLRLRARAGKFGRDLTFVGQLASLKVKGKPKRDLGHFVPRDFVTLEEAEGLNLLEEWRQAIPPLVIKTTC
jgi:hypothetical protein